MSAKDGHVGRDDRPDDLVVDPIVFMRDEVARPDDTTQLGNVMPEAIVRFIQWLQCFGDLNQL